MAVSLRHLMAQNSVFHSFIQSCIGLISQTSNVNDTNNTNNANNTRETNDMSNTICKEMTNNARDTNNTTV